MIWNSIIYYTMEGEKEKEDAAVDWLEIPDHLSFEIIGQLTCCSDYVRFGAVCVKWRSLLLEEVPKLLTPQLPMLILPTSQSQSPSPSPNREEDKERNRSCSFYRITDEKFYNELKLSMPSDRHFRGSGHGWLLTVDDDELSRYPIQLINPFFFPEPKVIHLPPLTTFPLDEDLDSLYNCSYLTKGVLSADPISKPNDYMVMAIYGGFAQLALFKSGDKIWTPKGYDSFKGLFEDVIYYRDQFYAVHFYGMITTSKKYLVECAGDLLQVNRVIEGSPGRDPAPDPPNNEEDINSNSDDSEVDEEAAHDLSYSTGTFKVFKLLLDPSGEKETDWVEVNDLHGRALFLGDNASMSINAFDFPGCKPNCIYYTDDNMEIFYQHPLYGPHDLGVF